MVEKRRIVIASGTFDLLHLGHVKYLEEAKSIGGENSRLIVIVAKDHTVKRMKGRKPVMPEGQRKILVEALKVVDSALLGYEDLDIIRIIEKVKPDIIALGHDQNDIEMKVLEAVEKIPKNIKIVRIAKYGEDELNSSSKIKKKISEVFRS